jgi:hypothetical protein
MVTTERTTCDRCRQVIKAGDVFLLPDLVTTVCPGCTNRAMTDYLAGDLERDPFTGARIVEDALGVRQ